MIKNSIFEANLVMSTLLPEEESVLLQQQLNQTQHTVQLLNISQSESIFVDVEMPSIATDTDGNSSVPEISGQRKRNRIVSQASNANSSDMFQLTNDNADGCDILQKKRKTTERREMHKLPMPAVNPRTSENQAPPECDLLSENINVVFQDDTIDSGLIPNDADDDDLLLAASAHDAQPIDVQHRNRTSKRVRDHRSIVRHVFKRCFTGSSQQTQNLGAILAVCSDEE